MKNSKANQLIRQHAVLVADVLPEVSDRQAQVRREVADLADEIVRALRAEGGLDSDIAVWQDEASGQRHIADLIELRVAS